LPATLVGSLVFYMLSGLLSHSKTDSDNISEEAFKQMN